MPARKLPPTTRKPCSECPWVRTCAPGWLGPFDADTWLEAAHSDAPIACHTTIVTTDEKGVGSWEDPHIKQCAGAAIFRSNVFKSPRDPAVLVLPADKELVFSWNDEFREHHEKFKQ